MIPKLQPGSGAAEIGVPGGLLHKLTQGRDVLFALGPRWALYRLQRAVRLRTGSYRRASPCQTWAALPAPMLAFPDFFPSRYAPPGRSGEPHVAGRDDCTQRAHAILSGEFRLFGWADLRLGPLPDWQRNPFTGQRAPAQKHWSSVPLSGYGDVKAVWELSRFGWAFTLARAYARTRAPELAEGFWRLFEDWCEHNPPNTGVQWSCGQEASFRLIACTFAVSVMRDSSASTLSRQRLWSKFVLATGQRIVSHLDYALSQANNHGISECTGLLTAALLSPVSTQTQGWKELATQALKSQLDQLLYPDGGFAQHSLSYQRLVLDDLVWAVCMLRAMKLEVAPWLQEALNRATAFLEVLTAPESGQAPLYGPNDSADVLPWDDAGLQDLRPRLRCASRLLGAGCTEEAASDERSFWATLGRLDSANGGAHMARLPAALHKLHAKLGTAWHAPHAGMLSWTHGAWRASLRCPTRFNHRPTQADMLHVDVAYQGQRVALDAGSYSYHASPPFEGALAEAAVHNVPLVAGREPMRRASRFLLVPWPHGTAEFLHEEQAFRASHDSYAGIGVTLTRSLEAHATGFAVVDRVSVPKRTQVSIHWLLADLPWELEPAGSAASSIAASVAGQRLRLSWHSRVAAEVNLLRADETSARGWQSPNYLQRLPAISLKLTFWAQDSLQVTSLWSSAES